MKMTTRELQLAIAAAVSVNNWEKVRELVYELILMKKAEGKTHWVLYGARLLNTLRTGIPSFSIFALKGNRKLPFVSFSSMAIATCPGAGECKDFCYSLKAWQYPGAFYRQVQNAFLMASAADRRTIENELDRISRLKAFKAGFDLRLYVDGDFSNAEDVTFWMNILEDRPLIRAYGYSKSFAAIMAADKALNSDWPSNYTLNLSSGHNAPPYLVGSVQSLPITRGQFIAVNIGRRVKETEWRTKSLRDETLKAFGKGKAFVCPGECGSCTGKGHICGNRFVSVPVIIPMH